ncbi:MAG: hypothetical protein ACLRZZ_28505 [Enterocloster sp.]
MLGELVETITWSGDSGQIARKLEFAIAPRTRRTQTSPNVTINEGDQSTLLQTDTGTFLFGGIIFDIEKMAGSNLVRYLAYDLIFYLTGSELTKDYNGAPEDVAKGCMRGTWNHGRNYGSHGYYNHESMCKDRISGHTIILYGSRPEEW